MPKLIAHALHHTGKMPFRCDICDVKTYTNIENMERHQRSCQGGSYLFDIFNGLICAASRNVGPKRNVSAAKVDGADHGPPPLIWFPEHAKTAQRHHDSDLEAHWRPPTTTHIQGKSAARTVSERVRTGKAKDNDDDPDYLPMKPHYQAIRRSFRRRRAQSSSRRHILPRQNAIADILHLDDETPSSTSSGSNIQGFIDDQRNQSFLHLQEYQQQQMHATMATLILLQRALQQQKNSADAAAEICGLQSDSTYEFQGQITEQAISSEHRYCNTSFRY
jgi:hypothetical protein